MDALMWEVKAALGRGAELATWVRDKVVPALRTRPEVERVEVFASGPALGRNDECVVLIVLTGRGARVAEPPPPPALLAARPPHAWWFRRLEPT